MPLYTFYPRLPDGTSATFETYDLVDDDASIARARRVAEDHRSCEAVAIWCGSRRVRQRDEEEFGHAMRPSA